MVTTLLLAIPDAEFSAVRFFAVCYGERYILHQKCRPI